MAKVRNKDNLYIGALHTTEQQCGWPECDSWKTLEFHVVARTSEEEVAEMAYPLCREHLFEFIDRHVFGSTTNTILRADGTVEE